MLPPIGVSRNVKIGILPGRIIYRLTSQEGPVEQAGSGLEEIVARSLRQLPPREAPLMAWPVVCGSAVAERTRALRFLDGVLQIGVPDYGWKTELQALAPRYLAEVNRYTKEAVRKIDFVITPMDGDDNSH